VAARRRPAAAPVRCAERRRGGRGRPAAAPATPATLRPGSRSRPGWWSSPRRRGPTGRLLPRRPGRRGAGPAVRPHQHGAVVVVAVSPRLTSVVCGGLAGGGQRRVDGGGVQPVGGYFAAGQGAGGLIAAV